MLLISSTLVYVHPLTVLFPLTQEEAKVVHRDLATRNVLVVNERQVKISDFGLARLRFENKDYYQGKDKKDLPIYW